MTQPDKAILRLREITERKGQKITARDIATAHLAIAALEHLQERGQHDSRVYRDMLVESVDCNIQLHVVREMLADIRSILE